MPTYISISSRLLPSQKLRSWGRVANRCSPTPKVGKAAGSPEPAGPRPCTRTTAPHCPCVGRALRSLGRGRLFGGAAAAAAPVGPSVSWSVSSNRSMGGAAGGGALVVTTGGSSFSTRPSTSHSLSITGAAAGGCSVPAPGGRTVTTGGVTAGPGGVVEFGPDPTVTPVAPAGGSFCAPDGACRAALRAAGSACRPAAAAAVSRLLRPHDHVRLVGHQCEGLQLEIERKQRAAGDSRRARAREERRGRGMRAGCKSNQKRGREAGQGNESAREVLGRRRGPSRLRPPGRSAGVLAGHGREESHRQLQLGPGA